MPCVHTHTHTRPQQRTGAFSNSRGLWWRCNTALHIRLHLVSAQLHRAPSHRTQAFTVHAHRCARVDPCDRRPPPALRGSTVELVRVYIVYGGQSRRGASGARARAVSESRRETWEVEIERTEDRREVRVPYFSETETERERGRGGAGGTPDARDTHTHVVVSPRFAMPRCRF